MRTITVSVSVHAPIAKVWNCWTVPKHIVQWNAASDDWRCPASKNDVRVGGRFCATMAAKDGSASFDFEGTYTAVKKYELLAYTMADGRKVEVRFTSINGSTTVTETFDPESENPEEMQRQGWQAILDNFKRHTEAQ